MKRILSTLLAFALCLILTGCSLFSDESPFISYSVSGKVERFCDQKPLSDAILTFADSRGRNLGTVTTDELGRWEKGNLRGQVSISVAKEGYALHPNQFQVSRAGKWTIRGHITDGPSLIAFTVFRESYEFEIGVVSPDGSDYRVITSESCWDPIISWSPDGRQLACSMPIGIDRTAEICMIDVNSGMVNQLTTNACNDLRPAWSVDGTMIAFETSRDAKGWAYAADVVAKNEWPLWELGHMPPGIPLQWMPSSNDIVAGYRQGYIYGMDPYLGTPLWNLPALSRIYRKFEISLDARRIVFEKGFGYYHDSPIDICIRDADGGTEERLTRNWESGHDSRFPSFSPNGKQIAFVRANDLWVMNADGTDAHPIVEDVGRISYPVWSPVIVH